MTQEFVNPSQIYKNLINCVLNECNCDELLPYQTSNINYMFTQLEHFDNVLKNSKNLDQFIYETHKLEVERIKFLLHKYLEKRIKKIEKEASNLINILKNDRQQAVNLMSIEEITYLQKYVSDIDCYLNDILLKNMPPNMQMFNIADINYDHSNDYCVYNFVKANKETRILVNDPSGPQIVDLKENDQFLLPFCSLKPNLFSNDDLSLL